MESFDEQWQDAFLDGLTLAADYPREGQARRVKATMASILEDAYYKYREQGKTAVDLGEVIRDLMQEYELPAFLDGEDSQVVLPGKRQPTMGESIVASLERYHFMEQLEGTFGEKIEGIVVGGSMSYGPFFNVRDGEDSSDIDAIMVADDTFFDDDEWRGLTDSAILTEEDKVLFLARKKVFEQLYKDGEAKVFALLREKAALI